MDVSAVEATVVLVVAAAGSYVMVRQGVGNAWKSVAEGYEKKAAILDAEIKVKEEELKRLRNLPDLTGQAAILERLVQAIDRLEHRMNEHDKATQAAQRSIQAGQQSIIQAVSDFHARLKEDR